MEIERSRSNFPPDLSRSVETQVVRQGFLFPLGARVDFVKVTKRDVFRDAVTGDPIPALVQRMFLSCPERAERSRDFGWSMSAWTGVGLAGHQVHDVVDPWASLDFDDRGVAPGGLIRLGTLSTSDSGGDAGFAFWPRHRNGPGGEVEFDIGGADLGQPARAALIFVDSTAAAGDHVLSELVAQFARHQG